MTQLATPSPPFPGQHPRLPQRPRFLQELVVIHSQGRTIIEGAHQPYTLEGVGAQKLLPSLIPLMNGTRTLQQIRQELPGIPAAAIHSAISYLFRCGLVEDVSEREPADRTAQPEALSFFRRFAGRMSNGTGWDAYRRLQDSEILILSSGQSASQICSLQELLRLCGAKRVTSLTPESLIDGPARSSDRVESSLVVACSLAGEDLHLSARLDRWCHSKGYSWLRAVLDLQKGYADLGPFFDGINPCYECFTRMHGDAKPSGVRLPEATRSDLNPEILSALLALEIVNRLSETGLAVSERGFLRYELKEWKASSLHSVRVPGCHRCRPVPGAPSTIGESIDVAIVFEDHLALSSRPRISRNAEVHLAEIGADLSRQFTMLSHCKQIALPELEEEPRPGTVTVDSAGDHSFQVHDLAAILRMTAGIQPQSHPGIRRWAATAGNLGSVELFLAVRKVSGLSPGIYFYQAQNHSLALFRNYDEPEVARFMQRVARPDFTELPEVLVLFMGALYKLTRKYSHFGYRLLHLDAGVALCQLQLAARSRDHAAQPLHRWADDLVEQELNLNTGQVQLTAVASLSKAAAATSWAAPSGIAQNGYPKSARNIRDFSANSTEQILNLLVHTSRVTEQDLSAVPFAIAPELIAAAASREATSSLPAPREIQTPPEKLLARRTSTRCFPSRALSLDQIGSMLCTAQRGDVTDWPEEHAARQDLGFVVLAASVDNLRPGLYGYDYDRHDLALTREPTGSDIAQLFVQTEFGAAPAVIFITGNLAGACARWGAFGYRQLLLRAGAAANRLGIAALDLSLAGCIVAGVVAGATIRVLGFDGYRMANLLAFAVGHSPNLYPSTLA